MDKRTGSRSTTVRLTARLVNNETAVGADSGREHAEAFKRENPEGEIVEREILREHRLELVVNEQTIERLVCTGEDLENLVVGRLITERIIAGMEDVGRLCLCENGNRAEVFLKQQAYAAPQNAECSLAGAGVWKPEWIFGLADVFAGDFRLHKRTGGIHGCMLGRKGSVLYQTEDIGRHNAMDKAIGYGARMGIAPEDCMLFTTGRVPTDMVKKAVAAGIPVLVSKAVPTLEAVELARRCGLVLICRAWPDSFEIYTDGGFRNQNE